MVSASDALGWIWLHTLRRDKSDPKISPKPAFSWSTAPLPPSFYAFLPPNIRNNGVKKCNIHNIHTSSTYIFPASSHRRTRFWSKLPRAFSYQKIKHFEILFIQVIILEGGINFNPASSLSAPAELRNVGKDIESVRVSAGQSNCSGVCFPTGTAAFSLDGTWDYKPADQSEERAPGRESPALHYGMKGKAETSPFTWHRFHKAAWKSMGGRTKTTHNRRFLCCFHFSILFF